MNFQLNFKISPQKEKELFAFLSKECDCSILRGYGVDKNLSVDICEDPSLYLYIIAPRGVDDIVRIEPVYDGQLGANFIICPLDEFGRNLPLIQYERTEGPYRIYAGTSTMRSPGKAAVHLILHKIKRWVKANANSQKRDGTWFCGITIYDVQ